MSCCDLVFQNLVHFLSNHVEMSVLNQTVGFFHVTLEFLDYDFWFLKGNGHDLILITQSLAIFFVLLLQLYYDLIDLILMLLIILKLLLDLECLLVLSILQPMGRGYQVVRVYAIVGRMPWDESLVLQQYHLLYLWNGFLGRIVLYLQIITFDIIKESGAA